MTHDLKSQDKVYPSIQKLLHTFASWWADINIKCNTFL